MGKRSITRCLAFAALAIGLACLTACEPRLPDLPGQVSYNSRLVGLGSTVSDVEKVFGRCDYNTGDTLYFGEHNLTVHIEDGNVTVFALDGSNGGIITYKHMMVGEHEANLFVYFDNLHQVDVNTYAASFQGKENVGYELGDTLIVYTVEDEKVTSITISSSKTDIG